MDEDGNKTPLNFYDFSEVEPRDENDFHPGRDMPEVVQSAEFTIENAKIDPLMWLLFTNSCRLEDRDYWLEEDTPEEHPRVAD